MQWYRFMLTNDQVMLRENVELVLACPVDFELYRQKAERNSGPETYLIPPHMLNHPYSAQLMSRYSGEYCVPSDVADLELVGE